jgi:serine/threonine-protein kinase
MAGFAEGLAADPRVGQLLGSYHIVKLLGRGGMGVVYLAEHNVLGRNVALKLLAPALAQNGVVRERFVRESRRAAAIDHPNIIPVYEAGEADGSLFIAMRYVAGCNLRELLIENGPLGAEPTVRMLSQVASALDAAHRVGLVHRDVKPANVMVDAQAGESEHCYLTDFGLTKDVSSSTGFTDTGQFVGTINYVAPEQVEARPLDARTDVYALGCVLHECLTGKVPFVRENDLAVMFAHVSEPPPAVSTLRPELGTAIDSVVTKALAKSPDDRQGSCSELLAEARAALHDDQPAQSTERAPRLSPDPSVPPPPSRRFTRPEPALPPPPPPPVWPSVPAPPAGASPAQPDTGGPNYLLAAAIVAIAVLLTAGGIAAALVLTGRDDKAKPGSAASADARRLIEDTAQLNREVIDLEHQLARQSSDSQRAISQLGRQRDRARRLAARARSDLNELRRVQVSLVASTDHITQATADLRRYLRSDSPRALDAATFGLQQSAGEVNDAATEYQHATGASSTALPNTMQVDTASLPTIKLRVPDDANISIVAGPTQSVDSVQGVGDVNGDGRGDVLAAVSTVDSADSTSYVVYGQKDASVIDVSDLGDNGFEIGGGNAVSYGAAPAGDVDGDGKADIVLAAAPPDLTSEQRWFVIFGAEGNADVNLDDPSDRAAVLRLSGSTRGDYLEGIARESVVGVGDVNGDGHGDVAVGSPPRGAYVVTDVQPGGDVAVDSPGSGFRISGLKTGDALGGSLARAGDVNGDNRNDILIGAPYKGQDYGGAYIVFGSSESADVDVTNLGDRGITFPGEAGTVTGGSLGGIGDVNGDGLGDVVVGAPGASPSGRTGAGVAYVVFGRREPGRIVLDQLGAGGFRIDGPARAKPDPGEISPGIATYVAGNQDINGDDVPDLVLGATYLEQPSALAYVVYGKGTTSRVDLRSPGGQAAALEGDAEDYLALGDPVDFNNDGTAEVVFATHPVSSTGSGHLLSLRR